MADQEPQAHSELATFGEELKREREIRGISLKEIADETKISKRFLEALERNDHKTLPAPVFTRGFVRQYARYLGLNTEDIVNRYNYAAAGDDRIEKSAHLDRLVQPVTVDTPPPRKGIPPVYARVDRNIYVTIAIIIALALVGWWAFRYKQQRNAEQAEARPVVIASTSAAAAKPQPAPPPPPAQTATNPDMLHLTIDINDDSWITLEADGKVIVSDELKAGEHHTYDAKDRFRFKTVGNAGGVAITINDVKVPSLGRERQVVHDRIFDRAWLSAHASSGQSHT